MEKQSPSAKKWPEGATIEAIEDAVERARPFAEELRGTLEAALHGAGQEWRNLDFQVATVTNIFARAILKARGEAFEAAAKIAEDFEINNTLLPFATDDTANQAAAVGQEFACDEIASAIRQHSQKGER